MANKTATDLNQSTNDGKPIVRLFVDNADGSFSEKVAIGQLIPGTGSTNLGSAEDSVHGSGDVGVMDLGVQYNGLVAPNANGDYSFFSVDNLGKQIAQPYTHLDNQVQGVTASMAAMTSTVGLPAVAAVRNYATSISVTNTSATGTVVAILDGATIIDYISAPGSTTAGPGYNDKQFPVPLRCSVNSALNFQNLTTGAAVFASVQGFKAL